MIMKLRPLQAAEITERYQEMQVSSNVSKNCLSAALYLRGGLYRETNVSVNNRGWKNTAFQNVCPSKAQYLAILLGQTIPEHMLGENMGECPQVGDIHHMATVDPQDPNYVYQRFKYEGAITRVPRQMVLQQFQRHPIEHFALRDAWFDLYSSGKYMERVHGKNAGVAKARNFDASDNIITMEISRRDQEFHANKAQGIPFGYVKPTERTN